VTNEELKRALMSREPVILDSVISFHREVIECAYVSAIIYRRGKDGKIDVSAELADKNLRGVIKADPANVRFKDVQEKFA